MTIRSFTQPTLICYLRPVWLVNAVSRLSCKELQHFHSFIHVTVVGPLPQPYGKPTLADSPAKMRLLLPRLTCTIRLQLQYAVTQPSNSECVIELVGLILRSQHVIGYTCTCLRPTVIGYLLC